MSNTKDKIIRIKISKKDLQKLYELDSFIPAYNIPVNQLKNGDYGGFMLNSHLLIIFTK